MSKTVFINGANGFLAPHVIEKYMDKGYSIIAASRSKGSESAQQRVLGALESVNKNRSEPLDPSRIEVLDMGVTGDATLMASQIDQAAQKLNPEGKVDVFILNAASVDMSIKNAETTWDTNVLGMENMVSVVGSLSKPPEVVINVSTAYSAEMGEPGKNMSENKKIDVQGDFDPEAVNHPYEFGGNGYGYDPQRDGGGLSRYANPYAHSKHAADAVFRTEIQKLQERGLCEDTRIVTVLPGLIIGEGSDFGPASVMPILERSSAFIAQYLEGRKPLYITQNPDSEVNSMRVEDVALNIVEISEATSLLPPGSAEGALHITNSQRLTYEGLLRNMFISVGIKEDLVKEANFVRVDNLKGSYDDDEISGAISLGMRLAERGLGHYGNILRNWDVHLSPNETKRFLEANGRTYHESPIGPQDFKNETREDAPRAVEGNALRVEPLPIS